MITTAPAAPSAAGHRRQHQTTFDIAPSPVQPAASDVGVQVLVLAGLSLGAAAIHVEVIPEHLKEYWPYAAFFAVVALLQAGWALAAVRRPSRRLCLLGAIMSAVLVALWVLSRTTGLPIGPHPWHSEPVALTDVLAGTLEGTIILGASVRILGRRG
jgi:hypothetical protein